MTKNKRNLKELYFPTDLKDRYEYVLQRFKKVLADEIQILKVTAIRRGPEPRSVNEFPSTEVVIQLVGIPFEYPTTRKPVVPSRVLKSFFEGRTMQRAFLKRLGGYVATGISREGRLAKLKKKLQDVTAGRPSRLPARLDLLLLYWELVEELKVAKKWLRERHKGRQRIDELATRNFVETSPVKGRWWIDLVAREEIALAQILRLTPQIIAKLILAKKLGVSEEAVHSRLFRKEG